MDKLIQISEKMKQVKERSFETGAQTRVPIFPLTLGVKIDFLQKEPDQKARLSSDNPFFASTFDCYTSIEEYTRYDYLEGVYHRLQDAVQYRPARKAELEKNLLAIIQWCEKRLRGLDRFQANLRPPRPAIKPFNRKFVM